MSGRIKGATGADRATAQFQKTEQAVDSLLDRLSKLKTRTGDLPRLTQERDALLAEHDALSPRLNPEQQGRLMAVETDLMFHLLNVEFAADGSKFNRAAVLATAFVETVARLIPFREVGT